MEIIERELKGVYEISLKPLHDARGFFMRTFDDQIFKQYNIHFNWVQENHSLSLTAGTIRGFHFQLPPYSETKLVRCISGAILDVFIDLRKGSDTFGMWGSAILSADNHKMLLIPRGFAHGFCSLVNNSSVIYKVDNYYNSFFERGLLWNDTHFNVPWPFQNPIISEKDKRNMTFEQFLSEIKNIEV